MRAVWANGGCSRRGKIPGGWANRAILLFREVTRCPTSRGVSPDGFGRAKCKIENCSCENDLSKYLKIQTEQRSPEILLLGIRPDYLDYFRICGSRFLYSEECAINGIDIEGLVCSQFATLIIVHMSFK